MRRTAAVMVVAGVLVLGACGGASSEASDATTEPARMLSGTFTLSDSSGIFHPTGAKDCVGKGGYDDVEPGMRVLVADGEGRPLATGQLGTGIYKVHPTFPNIGDCVFPIVVPTPLPRVDFYTVSIGRRGESTYSYAELEAEGWELDFTLG
jgi:hypothetical protein